MTRYFTQIAYSTIRETNKHLITKHTKHRQNNNKIDRQTVVILLGSNLVHSVLSRCFSSSRSVRLFRTVLALETVPQTIIDWNQIWRICGHSKCWDGI